jgi:uncharacterized protein (TIGR00290 family)
VWELLKAGDYEIVALITSFTEEYDRICMHGVRRVLLEKQATSIGIPLEIITLKTGADSEAYDKLLAEKLVQHKNRRLNTVAFGDIFLEDIRKHREEQLAALGMKALFPLWKRNTADLAHAFIRAGFKARITCVDTQQLDPAFCGREFTEKLLDDLPASIDPCGENGEFHSFVYDGPIFKRPIVFNLGEMVLREGRFRFCDLIPA